MVEYVVYYRVSTERQGRSGLGLDAQRTMVTRFIQPTDTITAEFTEIESGKNDKRLELWKAISLVKKTKAKLLIPKLIGSLVRCLSSLGSSTKGLNWLFVSCLLYTSDAADE